MYRHLAAATLISLALAACRATPAEPAPLNPEKAGAAVYDWGVAYYLSYDNDLEKAGPVILKQIREGVVAEKTVAAVQADYTDTGGMHRYVITPKGVTATRVASDDSASEEQALQYLEWFVKTYPCRRYVVIFLNHGGRLDELCLDEEPDTEGKFWMSGKVLGEKLRQFKTKMPGRWELLFFQQCGRGSLENLYSFRGTADFVMSSPVNVGSPNSYYGTVHKWLGVTPEATGDEVAAKIAEADRDFTVYSCVRAAKLEELPKRLNQMLAPFVSRPDLTRFPVAAGIYKESGEELRDAKTFFERLADSNQAGATEVAAFIKWTDEELCTHVWRQKKAPAAARSLCGLSLFVPDSAAEARRYSGLDFYRDSSLPALWEKWVKSASPPAAKVSPTQGR